jgi:tetratricopeptide (TPR) repeat protein
MMFANSKYLIVVTLAVVASCCFATSVFGAPWYEEYEEARKAIEDKEWQKALLHLNNAIEQRPEPKDRVRSYGTTYISYFPYLMRGFVHYNLGNYEDAMADFKTSQRYGAVKKARNRPRFANKLSEIVADIEQKLKERNAGGNLLARAEEVGEVRNQATDTSAAVEVVSPARFDNASHESSVDTNERSTPDIHAAGSGNQILTTEAAASGRDTRVSKAISSSQNLKAQNTQLLDRAIAFFREGRVDESSAALATVFRNSPDDSAAISFARTLDDFKRQVRAGVVAYFAGDYQVSLKSIRSAIETNDKIGSLHLLLGAIYWSQYRMGGETNEDLRQHAIRAFGNVKRLAPDYKPSEEFFPPLMLKVFHSNAVQ